MAADVTCGLAEVLVFIGALVAGTACSLCSKVLLSMRSVGASGEEQSFQNPLFQTWGMFLGMVFALPVHFVREALARRRYRRGYDAIGIERRPSFKEMPRSTYLLLAAPALAQDPAEAARAAARARALDAARAARAFLGAVRLCGFVGLVFLFQAAAGAVVVAGHVCALLQRSLGASCFFCAAAMMERHAATSQQRVRYLNNASRARDPQRSPCRPYRSFCLG